MPVEQTSCTGCGTVINRRRMITSQTIGEETGEHEPIVIECCGECQDFVQPIAEIVGGSVHKISCTINVFTALFLKIQDRHEKETGEV